VPPIQITRVPADDGNYQITVTGSINQLHRAPITVGVAMRSWAAEIAAGPVQRVTSSCDTQTQPGTFTYSVTYRTQE
jgi:hypothetical protein